MSCLFIWKIKSYLKGNSLIWLCSKQQILPLPIWWLHLLFISCHKSVAWSNSLHNFRVVNLFTKKDNSISQHQKFSTRKIKLYSIYIFHINIIYFWQNKSLRYDLLLEQWFTWNSKLCWPLSGSLCFVTKNIRILMICLPLKLPPNYAKNQKYMLLQLFFFKLTFVSWSSNFNKFLDVNTGFLWGRLSWCFLCLFCSSTSSER